MTIGKIRNYITWGLTILLALAFLAAGFAKVSGQPAMVEGFTAFGLPDWFRVTIGALEIGGGILLLVPAFTGMASFGLSIIMIGAVSCHVMYDPITSAIPAFILFLALTYIYITRKNVVPKIFQKLLIG